MPRALFILFLLITATSTSLAQGNSNGNGNGNSQSESGGNGNGNGNSNGQGNGNGNSQNSSGGGNGNGNQNDGNNGNGNANANGNGQGIGNGPASAAVTALPDTGIVPETALHQTPDQARDAVNAGQAVTLSSLLPDLATRGGGEVIDAELLDVRGFLVYAIKVLRADGGVTTQYYYAQSGRFIGSE